MSHPLVVKRDGLNPFCTITFAISGLDSLPILCLKLSFVANDMVIGAFVFLSIRMDFVFCMRNSLVIWISKSLYHNSLERMILIPFLPPEPFTPQLHLTMGGKDVFV